jgi:hypothetical protein
VSRPHSTARRGLAALAVSGLLTAGLTAVTSAPAQSAPDTQCPAPVPVAEVAEGDVVNGLTVTKGTTPGTFTGEIAGVLQDGIAPGVDMILADLESPAVDRYGIWQGMSGSPVYDADGALIGAVAYSLGTAPSTIAGITPASEMAKLLDDANVADNGTPVQATALPRKVALPRPVAQRLVADRTATSAQASAGLRQLRLPVSVSGLGTARLDKVAPKLRVPGGHVLGAPAGPASSEEIPVEAGGNMAAAVSFGTITLAGVGTATMVCDGGQRVVGFGHPMEFSGQSTKSLHGARALLIQDDASFGSFKLANIGAPVGTVDQDRRTGLRAILGLLPTATPVTTTSKVAGREATGTSQVNLQGAVPDVSFMHVAAIQDKVLDRQGKGRAQASWTIKGTRANGTPFSLTRSDLFANPSDISSETADAVASDVDAIANNDSEQVKISSVDVASTLSDAYATYKIAKVQVRWPGRWVTALPNKVTAVRAGYAVPVRLTLTSREGATKAVQFSIPTPKGAKNKTGMMHVLGNGRDVSDDDEFFTEVFGDFEEYDEGSFTGPDAPSSAKFPKLLASLKAQAPQNQLDVSMRFRASGTAGKQVKRTTTFSQVVSGKGSFPIVGR